MHVESRSRLVDIAIIAVLALIAFIGYQYSPLLLPKADLTLPPPKECDLNQQACTVDVPGGGSIKLSLTPRPIPVIKPIRIAVTVSGMGTKQVDLDFQGVQMNMGYNRVKLTKTDDDHYEGDATIPVCITGRMLWRATLMVEATTQRIAIPFLFSAPLVDS
jgi:hypothetical protein